ncbi:MAG: hypothetical protein FJ306_01780 [Planctomycetes bacterium]|nr:hypothetical protein [Planctomycetota bacterium]
MNAPHEPASRRTALAIVFALVAAAFAIALLAADRPRLRRPAAPDGARRAAFAVRDVVPPFQQWGTRAFTLPTLRSAYEHVDYLTLPDHEDAGKSAFLARLGPLLDANEHVDLFVLAHTNTCVEWVETLAASRRERLRLVYNTGCFDLAEREQWLRLGADAYVGHVGLSASSVFYVAFLRGWVRGEPLEHLASEGNAFTHRMLATIACFGEVDVDRIAAQSRAEISGNASLSVDGGRR